MAAPFFGCESKKEYSIETAMMECFTEQYLEYDIDVMGAIDSANAILISHKVMPNISGKSFIKMIEGIRDSSGLPFEPAPELITSLENLSQLPSRMTCRDSAYLNFDSTEFYNSKLIHLFEIFESIGESGDISAQRIASDFLEVFDEKDFDHPFYSTYGTLALTNLIKVQKNRDLGFNLHPIEDSQNFADSSETVLEVSMIKGDKLIIDGNEIETRKIVGLVETFITSNDASGNIKVASQRSVSYDMYIKVLDNIALAYNNFYDTKSLQLHELNYKDLSPEQQREIKAKYPKRISITEPGL